MALRTFSQMSGQRIERKLAAILAAGPFGFAELLSDGGDLFGAAAQDSDPRRKRMFARRA